MPLAAQGRGSLVKALRPSRPLAPRAASRVARTGMRAASDDWELPAYVRETLRNDGELALYRARDPARPGEPSVLLLECAATAHTSMAVRKLAHEYALATELDPTWAVRPRAFRREGHATLVLDDPGGEPLDRLIDGPMELERFLGIAVGLAQAVA